MNIETFILNTVDWVGKINFKIVIDLLLFALAFFWLVIIGWVWVDSGERTTDRATRVGYVGLVVVFNVIGLLIYFIIRPSETIEEIYWADLERRYIKYETSELGDCPRCGTQLYPGYVNCPNCGYKLKIKCTGCDVYIDKDNKYCPYCSTQMRERVVTEKEAPSTQVMEQQIQATKDEATQVVTSKKTKYKDGKSLAVKIGDSLLRFFDKTKEKITELLKKKEVKEENTEEVKKKPKKKKKKSKKKK